MIFHYMEGSRVFLLREVCQRRTSSKFFLICVYNTTQLGTQKQAKAPMPNDPMIQMTKELFYLTELTSAGRAQDNRAWGWGQKGTLMEKLGFK